MIINLILSMFLLGGNVAGASDIYNIDINTIEGKTLKFSEYKNKVVLIINTASKCGYTPQYKGLEELSNKYMAEGLVVLGMPCNQFGQQEPGAEGEIKEFCQVRYGVTFSLLKKGDVKGEGQHPLYKFLLENSPDKKEVAWNFEKFLVSREGEVLARFGSKTTPEDKDLIAKIEAALKR